MTKARTLADNFAADINGITAGTGITGGGTSGTVTITNEMATTIDAKGDLVVGTGADTFGRLAVASTAGYLLAVDSAETTGLKWAAPAAGGKVLQVVQATYSTQTTIATTSMTDTGLTATITPSSASSKVLVFFWHPWRMAGATTSRRISSGKLLRGATSIISPATDVAFAEMNLGAGEFSDTFLGGVWSVAYLDSPATTSATTYKTQAALNSATSMTLYMQTGTSMAAMILAEIGA